MIRRTGYLHSETIILSLVSYYVAKQAFSPILAIFIFNTCCFLSIYYSYDAPALLCFSNKHLHGVGSCRKDTAYFLYIFDPV